jgi:predicted phage-related endonuclease
VKAEHLKIPAGHRLHPDRPLYLTASDLAAAAGISAWKTPLQLHLEKTGQRPPPAETPPMKRGRLMEPVVEAYFREQHPHGNLYDPRVMIVDRELRLGATPDRVWEHEGELVNVQLKVVGLPAFERWEGVPPADYQVQVACEAMMLGAARSVLAVLVIAHFEAELHTFDQDRHADAEQRIIELAGSFWRRIDNRLPPPADYMAEPELVRELHPPDPDAPVPLDLTGNNRIIELLDTREGLKAAVKTASAELDAIDAEIIEKLGGAQLATAPGWKISRKIQHRAQYTVAEKDIPVMRITKGSTNVPDRREGP